jgi:glycerol-3-phosphate acyltransferase PlsX
MADFMIKTVGQEVLKSLPAERGDVDRVFASLGRRFEYSEAGGAPLLGIDGISIICHGSSNARSIGNAIKVATTFMHRHINSQIAAELSNGQPAA